VTNPFESAPQQAAPAPAAPQQQPGNPFGPGVPAAEPAPQYAPAPQQGYAPAAPQAYAPPQQPQYAPPTPQQQYAQPQQTYAPAPQQPAPAAAQQGYAGPALDVSTLAPAPPPPPSGDGNGAKLADMYGRLVLVFPHTCDTRPRNPQYITAEQRAQGRLTEELVTATVVVLDSGPGSSPSGGMIEFGGAPYELPPRPHTSREPLPYVRKAMWITQSQLVSQLKPFLPAALGGAQGMAAGRVAKRGPERNSPWYLEAATEPELELCRAYMRLVSEGRYPHPLA
jgi:hypothetical protein